MHATCTVFWWLYVVVYIYAVFHYWKYTIHSIPFDSDKKLVYMQLCVCYCSITLLCHLFHCIHYTGADTEAKNSSGRTPLMFACINSHREVAAALLEHGELVC